MIANNAARRVLSSRYTTTTRTVTNALGRRKNVASYHNSTKCCKKEPKDPHQVASDMVRNASDSRMPGTEALESITPAQKRNNFSMAIGLVAFATGVWYYSIQAVGKPEGGMDELRAEADEARDMMEKKSAQERTTEELAQLDVTMNQLQNEMGEDAEGIVVAVAAPDEIAQREEELMTSGTKKTGRPLWKKVVFFWKRE